MGGYAQIKLKQCNLFLCLAVFGIDAFGSLHDLLTAQILPFFRVGDTYNREAENPRKYWRKGDCASM